MELFSLARYMYNEIVRFKKKIILKGRHKQKRSGHPFFHADGGARRGRVYTSIWINKDTYIEDYTVIGLMIYWLDKTTFYLEYVF